MIQPVRFGIPKMETWKPDKKDIMFTNAKNIICAPIKETLNLDDESLNFFVIRPKKSYNSQDLRDHLCHVVNYFERYFDLDRELLVCMSRIKYMIDNFKGTYNYDNLVRDIRLYILGPSIKQKVIILCEYNYELDLKYKNIQAPLQYDNCHAKQLLEMSILMNFTIPLITHFAHKNRIQDIDEFILDVYDIILNMFPANMFSKLYETSYSNVSKSEYKNSVLWDKQDIRGKDTVTHSQDSVNNIILNIMPKYAFDRNIVALNYTSIAKNTSKLDCSLV